MSSARKYRAVTQQTLDIWKLEEARHEFWMGRYVECSKLLFPLCNKLIVEPLKKTKEYQDGERKPEESVSKPEEEEKTTSPFEEWTVPAFLDKIDEEIYTKRKERDDDGYLIR